jgi:vacuolar protein sorting-associated protein 26
MDTSQSLEFACLVRELAPPGFLTGSTSFPFEYANVEKQHESYDGINIRLRCVLDSLYTPVLPSIC